VAEDKQPQQDPEQQDEKDLELPDETAEQVKGGQAASDKLKPQKISPDKWSKIK
jgi:hypothetical protein